MLLSTHILNANRCCMHADANGVKQPSLCCGDPCGGVSCAWNVSFALDISTPDPLHGSLPKRPLCCGLHGAQEERSTPEWFELHSKVPSWQEPNSIDPTADCCIETPTCTGNSDRDHYPDVQCDMPNSLHVNALKPNSDRIIGRTLECCCTCEPTQEQLFKACVPLSGHRVG